MIAFKQTNWRFFAAVCACVLCLSIGLAQAATPFFWDSIDVDMTLAANGDLLVTETQTYVFTDSHSNERYRYIPLEGIDNIADVTVYENNEPLAIETGNRNNNYWIRWQHPLNIPATHTFVIKYRVVGGVQVKGNRSQLYWNALFPERSAAINRGRVTLQVPEALADQVTSFQGEGVASRDRKLNPTTFEFVAHGALEPQQFLNIRVEFPTSALDVSQAQTDYWHAKPSSLVVLFSWAGPGTILISIIGAIIAIRKRCPNCGKLTLQRTHRVVKNATRYSRGQREISHTCQHCNYDRKFNRTIPRKSSSSSSHGVWGGYDGGSSGGSGCSSSGCGGGGCGSGGCGGGG
ncbi:zinc ribbon nin one binding type [Leptolyngbya sp. Heron Island J]|uniref:DUF2207 domain-containing protein n=1 Tax=Leptolyngbya sp. Heron Island J TaxID=1385935 RepID=UPI0003B98BDE|nr:DUF2207 domain-containing protein [Leptolyngbya sp. Heron Island J]ESA35860.1 zinc ribbon nin one binding type [Leptolyngbya sp. Heron Island J]